MENEKIKPCPFCGGEANFCRDVQCLGHGEYLEIDFVNCSKCYARGSFVDDREEPKDESRKLLAIAAWNRRCNDGYITDDRCS